MDNFFGERGTFDRRRHLPALAINQSSQKLGRSGIVVRVREPRGGPRIGNQDGVDRYARFDVYPRLSRPMSVSFLQVKPEVQVRATRYGASGPTTGSTKIRSTAATWRPAGRCGARRSRGSSRTPGGFYSDRFKHVIGPEVTWTYRSKVEEFDSIPKFDHIDRILGTNEIHYALVQRLYAKRPGASGKPEAYEFLNWRVAQTYYVDIAEGQNEFDPNYSSAVFGPGGVPAHYSPLQSRLRLRPTPRLHSNFDLEYDVNFKMMRSGAPP